jgi:hypothetical protein
MALHTLCIWRRSDGSGCFLRPIEKQKLIFKTMSSNIFICSNIRHNSWLFEAFHLFASEAFFNVMMGFLPEELFQK